VGLGAYGDFPCFFDECLILPLCDMLIVFLSVFIVMGDAVVALICALMYTVIYSLWEYVNDNW